MPHMPHIYTCVFIFCDVVTGQMVICQRADKSLSVPMSLRRDDTPKLLTLNYFTPSQSDNVNCFYVLLACNLEYKMQSFWNIGKSISLDFSWTLPKISLFHSYIKKNIINKIKNYNKIYNKINDNEQSVMLMLWSDGITDYTWKASMLTTKLNNSALLISCSFILVKLSFSSWVCRMESV